MFMNTFDDGAKQKLTKSMPKSKRCLKNINLQNRSL